MDSVRVVSTLVSVKDLGRKHERAAKKMEDRARTPAVVRSAAVLRLLARSSRPLTPSAIAQEIAAPRTSVLRICESLSDERMLVRGRQGTYWLGPRIASLAADARLSDHHALTFGALIPNTSNAYYDALLAAAAADVESSGGRLIVHDASDDAVRQRHQWGELLELGADVVLVDAVETSGYEDLVLASHDRGIPVVAIGTRIDGADVAVTSDNIQAGLLSATALLSRLPDDSHVAILDGLSKNANAERISGFRDALRDHPQVHLVAHEQGGADDVESGRRATHRLIDDHPGLSGIFAVCDPLALGAAETLRDLQRTLAITAVDGLADATELIDAGGPILATSAQDPAHLARTALAIARQLHDGTTPRQRVVSLPVRLVTAADSRGYSPWG